MTACMNAEPFVPSPKLFIENEPNFWRAPVQVLDFNTANRTSEKNQSNRTSKGLPQGRVRIW